MANDKLMEALKKLETHCLDSIIKDICNIIIDDELFESLSAAQIGKLRTIIKDLSDIEEDMVQTIRENKCL